MATAGEEQINTRCTQCHDTFTVPKILPCGHLLCRDCLVTLLQSQPQAACPLCRCVIVEPKKQRGRSVEEVADGLPTDLAMTALVEAETLLSKQHVCCVCDDDVVAVALCLQCRDMFCERCRNVHTKQTVSKHHDVKELKSLSVENLFTHYSAACPDHKEEVCRLYCPTHDCLVCDLCVATTHYNCPRLVSQQSQVNALTAQLAQLTGKLTDTATKADVSLRLLDRHVEHLQREAQSGLDEIKKVCDRLKATIDARFLQVREKTLQLLSDLTMKIAVAKWSINEKRVKILTHKATSEKYCRFNSYICLKDVVRTVSNRMAELDVDWNLLDDHQLNQKFVMNSKTSGRIQRQLSRLGSVKTVYDNTELMKKLLAEISMSENMTPAIVKLPSFSFSPQQTYGFDGQIKKCVSTAATPEKCDSTTATLEKCDPTTATPSGGADIETFTTGDLNSPRIMCIVTGTSKEAIFMADENNSSIKICSLASGRLISALKLEHVPYGMALVRDNLLAVSSTTKEKVLTLVDITDIARPRVEKKLKTARRYYGIGAVRTNTDLTALVISCNADDLGPAGVDMISLTGELLGTIISTRNVPELRGPWYLHVDQPRDSLYVSDIASHCVFQVHLPSGKGRLLKHKRLSSPSQLCTDSQGNLYVASFSCVLVKSPGDAWRVLLTGEEHAVGGSVCPMGVCATDNGLVVSWNDGVVRKYDDV